MKQIVLIISVLCVCVCSALAQDVHFSQFYSEPLLTNPAFTGMFYGSYRFTSHYRSQWGSVTTPYVTFDGSVDFRFVEGKGRFKKDVMGLGLEVYSDKAGDASYTTTYVGATWAFNKAIDRFGTKYIGGGVMAGIGQAHLNFNNLTFDQDYTTGGNVYTGAFVGANQYQYVDMSAGVLYNSIPNKNENTYIGLSVYHFNNPVMSFTNDPSSRLERKYTLVAGGNTTIGQNWQLYPRIYAAVQGTQYDVYAGTFFRYTLSEDRHNQQAIYFGEWYRYGDALISVVRYDANDISVGISYDVNVSKLTPASYAQGGLELSFMYIGRIHKLFKSQSHTYCPRF